MEERFVIHGGALDEESIGSSCYTIDLLIADGTLYRGMIDSGINPGMVGANAPFSPDFSLLDDGKQIDFIVVTHAHVDHSGALGMMIALDRARVRAGKKPYVKENAPIVCSPQTGEIMRIVLRDGRRHQKNFTLFDERRVLRRRKIIPKPGVYEILPGLVVSVTHAGHIPGALNITFRTSTGKKITITGDTQWASENEDKPDTLGALLPSQSWPKEWIPDEILGTDLTYGSGRRRPVAEEVARLIKRIETGTRQDKKKIVIAGLSVGRAQNLAAWLSAAGITVWIDGVIAEIYRIFQKNRWSERDGILPPLDKQLPSGGGIYCVKNKAYREALMRMTGPVVVITTGGMGDFGPIVRYMQIGLGKSDWMFFFTSYLPKGTNGYALRELAKKRGEQEKKETLYFSLDIRDDKISQEIVLPFIADVDFFSLGAHSGLDELLAFIKDIVACREGKPLDRMALTHGTSSTKKKAAELLAPYVKKIESGERNTVLTL